MSDWDALFAQGFTGIDLRVGGIGALRSFDLRATVAPCEIHRSHTPHPAYCEKHHVVPQAWQVFYTPPMPWPYQGNSPDRTLNGHALILWDARTAALCRTGHGNVHYVLVAAMRTFATGPLDPAAAIKKAVAKLKADGFAASKNEVQTALDAMERFADMGGDLHALTAAGLFGAI